MMTKIRKMMRAEEGFTLIELMVVILIIGILMAIAIPSFIAVRNRGYASSAKSNRAIGVKTIELYATDNDGLYTDADAAALRALETSVTFVDAAPGNDEVMVSGVGSDDYVITVPGRDGVSYTATKTDGEAVVYAP
jgi:prepilin-type N-terminal cleavage/methylation domain-containing protein